MLRGVYLLLSFVFFSFSLFSQSTIESVAKGDWNKASTWDLNRIPNSTDRVLIQHEVEVKQGPYTVTAIEVNNGVGEKANLKLNSTKDFIISSNLTVTSMGINSNVDVEVLKNTKLYVNGNVEINREIFNNTNARARFLTDDNSETYIAGNFIYNYAGIGTTENHHEIELKKTSTMTVTNNFILNGQSGNEIELHLHNTSKLYCQKNFIINQSSADKVLIKVDDGALLDVADNTNFNNDSNISKDLELEIKGQFINNKNLNIQNSFENSRILLNISGANAEFWIKKNFEVNSKSEQDIFIDLSLGAKLYLLGNMTRAGQMGNLTMSDDSYWIYNGSSDQTIACTDGAGTDQLNFTNIIFENTGGRMTLEGNLSIQKELNLMDGIIVTSPTAKLILEDGASITGGGPNAYVEGPIELNSSTNVNDFEFPLGGGGRYAPMTITTAGGRATGGTYTANYYNCPPPWESDLAPNIQQISSQEHWTLERPSTATDVNVSLHWTDASAQGITNPSTLVVAMYNDPFNPHPSFSSGWTSIGNGGINNGPLTSSVSNISTCPPPWEIDQFTFGSVDNSNSLPVSMETFTANKKGQQVEINWATSSEVNASHYEVQKSTNGTDFYAIESINAKGNTQSMSNYKSMDLNPKLGTNYYRIRQIDYDGMAALTNVVTVDFDEETPVTAYPNPIAEDMVIKGETLSTAEKINVLDNMGRLIHSQDVPTNDGVLRLQPELLNIDSPGIYFVEIVTGSRSKTIRIVKS